MSRSYRHGFQCAGDKDFKKIFNRKLRRSQIKNTDNLPQYSDYKKMNCPWEIADYRGSISWEEFKNWYWIREMPEDEAWAEFQKYRSK